MVKRAPNGFIGMRGKKSDASESAESDDGYDVSNVGTFPWQNLAGSGSDDSDMDTIIWDDYAQANGIRYKKAPTAFYGVRGKKFSSSQNSYARRWNDLFEKINQNHLREVELQDVIDKLTMGERLPANAREEIQNEMSKRAPTGFTGVRGKRPSSSAIVAADGDYYGNDVDLLSKRGLGNAFVGVRGKKDLTHQTIKRSPAEVIKLLC